MNGSIRADAPFFVVGADRSGTTMLRLMLNQHRRLHVPRESWFLIYLLERFGEHWDLEEAEVREGARLITGHWRWADFDVPTGEFEAALGNGRMHLGELAAIPFRISATRAGKERWGDKTPRYVGYIRLLSRLFPQALFIHLVRDARDVCLSLQRRGWQGRIRDQAKFWAHEVGEGIRQGRELGADRYLQIRFEDLVEAPARTLESLCLFIGEEYDPSMLRYSDTAIQQVAEWERELHEKTVRPPDTSQIGRWKADLSTINLMVVEALAGPVMDLAGQPRHHTGLRRPVIAIFRRLLFIHSFLSHAWDRSGIPKPPLSDWLDRLRGPGSRSGGG